MQPVVSPRTRQSAPPRPHRDLAAPAAAQPAPWRPLRYALPLVRHVRLRFTLRSEGPARLPGFKGSLLRGAFGHALRQAACAFGPQQECRDCALRSACTYTRLFETFVEGELPPFLHGVETSPRPYVIEPATAERDFLAGDPLRFDLLLFGRATELQAFAVVAVERMAARGLGRDRHRFRLDTAEGMQAGGAWASLLPGAGRPRPKPVPALEALPPEWNGGALRVRFLTPTRLVVQRELVPSVSFRTLAFKVLRRHLELAHFYGDPSEIDWQFRPLLRRAADVKVIESALHWHDWQRYSNRQQTTMTLGGFVGHLVLAGDLAPFLPLLTTAEILHVGKGATFGLGKIAIEAAQ